MNQQFSTEANRLLNRIHSITFRQHAQPQKQSDQQLLICPSSCPPIGVEKPCQTTQSSLQTRSQIRQGKNRSLQLPLILSSNPQSQNILELLRLEQEITDNEDHNLKNIKGIYEQVRKIQTALKEEIEVRDKVHQQFLGGLAKADKSVKATIATIHKLYAERQRKLHTKIQQIITQQKNHINNQLLQHKSLQQRIENTRTTIISLQNQLVQMRKTRIELQSKISQQFNDQVADLKAVFASSIRIREERELKILDMLKNAYKRYVGMASIEQKERQGTEKMFLLVIEQLVDRIGEA